MRSDVVKCGYIQLSVIGTSHNIMIEQWFVYMKQRFLSITSDNVVFNENNILRVQKRNCVISIQLRPFSRHKSRKWTGMYLCVRGIDFASFCDFLLDIVFHLISRYFHHHHDLFLFYYSLLNIGNKKRTYMTKETN